MVIAQLFKRFQIEPGTGRIIRPAIADKYQFFGIRNRELTQKKRIKKTKDGSVCSDPECQGQGRDKCKDWPFPENAPAIAKIFREAFHPGVPLWPESSHCKCGSVLGNGKTSK